MKSQTKIFRVILITLAIIGLLLIYLNPSAAAFKNYAKEVGDPPGTLYKKKSNFLFFSYFSKEWKDENEQYGSYKYFGIAGNFYQLDKPE